MVSPRQTQDTHHELTLLVPKRKHTESQEWVYGALLWLRIWELTTRVKAGVTRRQKRPQEEVEQLFSQTQEEDRRALKPLQDLARNRGSPVRDVTLSTTHWTRWTVASLRTQEGPQQDRVCHRDEDSSGRQPRSSTDIPAQALLGDSRTPGS